MIFFISIRPCQAEPFFAWNLRVSLNLNLVDQMEQDLKVKERKLDMEIKAQWADAFAV